MSPAGVATSPGWYSVEELTRYAFGRSDVVMANEAHSGKLRCVRTRRVGERMIQAAHEAGVRRLAMEALYTVPVLTPVTELPRAGGGYLGQPDMRSLMSAALQLGWTLWRYEDDVPVGADPDYLVGLEYTNRRELSQAQHLNALVEAAPGEGLLVWCGNGHAYKAPVQDWVPMGHHFRALSGIDAFVIDQSVTVDFPGGSMLSPEGQAELVAPLTEFGGTAGLLREHAPDPLNRMSVDALVVSTDNGMI